MPHAPTTTLTPSAAAAQTAAPAPAGDGPPLAARGSDWMADCQSFLASSAVHLMALILLGLFAAVAERPPAVQRVEIQLGTGDDTVLGVEGRMKGESELDAEVADAASTAAAPDFFDPSAVAPPANTAVASETAVDSAAVAADSAALAPATAPSGDPFGDSSIANELTAALAGPGMGGQGLGDEGEGKDRWTGNGSPFGTQGPGAEFFGINTRGGSFVYVVDTSGSMNEEGKFERARAELLRSIEHLDHDQRYFIIFYNDGWFPMEADHPVLATPRQLDRTRRWVNRVWPGGGTFPMEALLHALSLEPDAIYFLSDGRFDPAVVDTLRQKNPKRYGQIPIHTIAFVNQETIPLMKKIAKQSGGRFRFVQ